jgi:homoserine kinase
VTNIGPCLGSLGLALGMHTVVEITERNDDTLEVETTGEGAGRYPLGLQHPVVLGLIRLFQRLERTALGLNIRVQNHIPHAAGLGVETAYVVAGLIGGNNLLGNPLNREDVLKMAVGVTQRPEHAVTAILGGLTTSLLDGEMLTYRSMPVASLRTVVVVPELEGYEIMTTERVLQSDALYNLSRVPMLIEGLRAGDHALLAQAMDDHLLAPLRKSYLPNYDAIVEIAKNHGASAVTTSENGPALVIFAPDNHRRIAIAIEEAFSEKGIEARTWILPVDTQGVVISAAQSG